MAAGHHYFLVVRLGPFAEEHKLSWQWNSKENYVPVSLRMDGT